MYLQTYQYELGRGRMKKKKKGRKKKSRKQINRLISVLKGIERNTGERLLKIKLISSERVFLF